MSELAQQLREQADTARARAEKFEALATNAGPDAPTVTITDPEGRSKDIRIPLALAEHEYFKQLAELLEDAAKTVDHFERSEDVRRAAEERH